MERYKEKKGISKSIISILIALSISYAVQAHGDTLDNNTKLINSILKYEFAVSNLLNSVDVKYITYKRTGDTSYCIAAPGKKFNNTDSRSGTLCNSRLVCYGKSNSAVGFILYEEEQGGRVGKACDIFEMDNYRIKNIVSIYVPPKTRNIQQLRRAIRLQKYTLVDSAHF